MTRNRWRFTDQAGEQFEDHAMVGHHDYIAVTMPIWWALELVQTVAKQMQSDQHIKNDTVKFRLVGLLEQDGEWRDAD